MMPTCPLCHQALPACRCGTTPAKAAPASRFVKRGSYMLCLDCGLTALYCRCASQKAVDQGAQDGAESGLAKRIEECRGRT